MNSFRGLQREKGTILSRPANLRGIYDAIQDTNAQPMRKLPCVVR